MMGVYTFLWYTEAGPFATKKWNFLTFCPLWCIMIVNLNTKTPRSARYPGRTVYMYPRTHLYRLVPPWPTTVADPVASAWTTRIFLQLPP